VRQPRADPGGQRPAGGGVGEPEHGVPLAGEALVELDHRPPQRRVAGLELGERAGEVPLVGQVLEPVRDGDPGLAQQLPAAALGAEVEQGRVAAEDRHAQPHGEGAFEGGHGEARHARRPRVRDRLADPGEQARPRQDLGAQGLRRRVVAAEQGEAPAGVLVRHAGQQVEVVVDDRLGDRLAGDVDQAGARLPQQEQHAEQALLVVVHPGDLGQHVLVDAQARDDDHRAGRVGSGEGAAEQLRQSCLEALEGLALLR
jgi:hypothetical protein